MNMAEFIKTNRDALDKFIHQQDGPILTFTGRDDLPKSQMDADREISNSERELYIMLNQVVQPWAIKNGLDL